MGAHMPATAPAPPPPPPSALVIAMHGCSGSTFVQSLARLILARAHGVNALPRQTPLSEMRAIGVDGDLSRDRHACVHT